MAEATATATGATAMAMARALLTASRLQVGGKGPGLPTRGHPSESQTAENGGHVDKADRSVRLHLQVSHRSCTPQEEGLLCDRVGDAHLAALASGPGRWVLQLDRQSAFAIAPETIRRMHRGCAHFFRAWWSMHHQYGECCTAGMDWLRWARRARCAGLWPGSRPWAPRRCKQRPCWT